MDTYPIPFFPPLGPLPVPPIDQIPQKPGGRKPGNVGCRGPPAGLPRPETGSRGKCRVFCPPGNHSRFPSSVWAPAALPAAPVRGTPDPDNSSPACASGAAFPFSSSALAAVRALFFPLMPMASSQSQPCCAFSTAECSHRHQLNKLPAH